MGRGKDSRYTWFQVEEDDILPPGLCRTCAEDVITAAKFKDLCDTSSQHWAAAVDYLSKLDIDSEEKALFVSVDNSNDVLICGRQKLKAKIQPAHKRAKRTKPKEFACACPFCDKKFISMELLSNHLKRGQKRVCRDCGLVLTKSELAEHLDTAHQKETVECDVCHDLFNDYSDVHAHVKEYHGPSSFTCKNCGRGHKNERALRAHMYSHTLFSCDRCRRSFENNGCYKHHCKICTKEKATFNQYECDDCGLKYDKKPSLKIHIIQKHLNVLPFICKTCGKRTSTLSHLRSHEKVHEKNRQLLECHCGAKFRTKLGHSLHMRTHIGLKPYKCSLCEETFISASRRLDHMKRRHSSTKELAHGCEMCSARFIRPWELRKHVQCHQSVTAER